VEGDDTPAMLNEEPLVLDGLVCLLTATHYIVTGSIGTHLHAMRSYSLAMDTCSGYNLIRRSCLPDGWEDYRMLDEQLPALGDANGKRLPIDGAVSLRLRLGNTLFRAKFFVAPTLAVPVIVGTAFMNRHVEAIRCRRQVVELFRGSTIPILATGTGASPLERDDADAAPSQPTEGPTGDVKPAHRGRKTDGRASTTHVVKVARAVTVPPMSQMAIEVTSTACGLVFLEPKPSVQARHGVRIANGIAEVKPNESFLIIISNFSKLPRKLGKHLALAYAIRSPIGIFTPERKIGEAFEKVLNLPFFQQEGREGDDRTSPSPEGSDPPAAQPSDWRDTVDLAHLEDPELEQQILRMLESHADMWAPGRLGVIDATEHRIELQPGTKPIRSMPYRQGPALRAKAATEIRKMLDAGVIEPATSEWASPIVLVPKKDATMRFCVDYRRLNAKTVGDAYPLPRIDDCLDSLGDASIFSTLDCNAGYWQVPVAPEDQDKTTFTSYMGTFRYVRMPFGLRNAPATFQRALDIILSRVRWQTCLIYLDDVIVFSHTVAEHLRHVDEVLTLLRAAGVTLKLSKCRFFQPKVDYLGHVITPGKLHVATANTQAFESAKFPRSLTQLRSFLGAANVYRRFVKDYAKIARPLNSMLSKDAEPDWDDPSPDQIEAFDTLKARLVAPPILGLPMKDRPFNVAPAAKRRASNRMDAHRLLVEDVDHCRVQLHRDRTRVLFRRMGNNVIATIRRGVKVPR